MREVGSTNCCQPSGSFRSGFGDKRGGSNAVCPLSCTNMTWEDQPRGRASGSCFSFSCASFAASASDDFLSYSCSGSGSGCCSGFSATRGSSNAVCPLSCTNTTREDQPGRRASGSCFSCAFLAASASASFLSYSSALRLFCLKTKAAHSTKMSSVL